MKIDASFIQQLVSFVVTFAVILSHYWVAKMKIAELEYRVKTLEDKASNHEILKEKILTIETTLKHIETMIKDLKTK